MAAVRVMVTSVGPMVLVPVTMVMVVTRRGREEHGLAAASRTLLDGGLCADTQRAMLRTVSQVVSRLTA